MFWLWFVSVSFFTRLVFRPKNVWVESYICCVHSPKKQQHIGLRENLPFFLFIHPMGRDFIEIAERIGGEVLRECLIHHCSLPPIQMVLGLLPVFLLQKWLLGTASFCPKLDSMVLRAWWLTDAPCIFLLSMMSVRMACRTTLAIGRAITWGRLKGPP